MSKYVNEYNGSYVDTRYLTSGQIRLRFKLNRQATLIVEHAVKLTNFKHINSAIDAICISVLGSHSFIKKPICESDGTKRFIVKLFPEEYEIVRETLNSARQLANSDAEALTLICITFIAYEEIML